MKEFRLIAVLLATGGISLAHADDFYVKAGLGASNTSFENVDSGTATQVTLGYRFNHSPLGVEISYMDLGSMGISSQTGGGTLQSSGGQLVAVWNFYQERAPGNVYLKAGVYSMDTELKYTPSSWVYQNCLSGDCKVTSNGAVWGVGGSYRVSKDVSLYGEMDAFPGIDYVEDKSDTTVVVVGARLKF